MEDKVFQVCPDSSRQRGGGIFRSNSFDSYHTRRLSLAAPGKLKDLKKASWCYLLRGLVVALDAVSVAILCTRGGLNVVRKEAWLFCRGTSGVRLCWELEEPEGPKGVTLKSVVTPACSSAFWHLQRTCGTGCVVKGSPRAPGKAASTVRLINANMAAMRPGSVHAQGCIPSTRQRTAAHGRPAWSFVFAGV